MTPEIMHELERLRRVFSVADIPFQFSSPATEEQIDQLESVVGVRFDQHLRALWQVTNGSGRAAWFARGDEDMIVPDEFTPCSFHSLEEAHEWWDLFSPYDQAIYDKWRWDEGEEKGFRDQRIQPVYLHHKLWVPICEFPGGSDEIYFDGDPAASGEYGQLIVFCHDPDVINYVAPDFLSFFRHSNTILESFLEDEELIEGLREWMT